MRTYGRDGFAKLKGISGFGFILLYVLILLGIYFVGTRLDKKESTVIYGSLDGRYQSAITLELGGQTLHYRENEIVNYLLIGVDKPLVLPNGSVTFLSGQGDFLLVISVDRRNRTVTPLMIDRDTITDVQVYGVFGDPAGTRRMQICLAQAFRGKSTSGSVNTAQAVSGLLQGIKIDRWMVVDTEGIALLNDALGGVTVTLQDDLTALDPALKKGESIRLQGKQAEYFVRGRMSVADGTNSSRMERQKQYLDALLGQLINTLKSDTQGVNKVLKALSGHFMPSYDINVLINDINAYGVYAWQDMRRLAGNHQAGEDGFVEFIPDEGALKALVAEIWFK